jgi:hypothetical protein
VFLFAEIIACHDTLVEVADEYVMILRAQIYWNFS